MTHRSTDELVAHGRFLRGLARRLVADPHLADDLAQDAMVAALRAPPPRTSLRGYLAGTLRNLVKMQWRSEGRRRVRQERTAMSLAGSAGPARPDEVAERLEIQESVARAVRELPEPYRETVFLRFLEDCSAAEIAKRQGVPASTVRSRVQKALGMLRERLDATHGDRARWQLALLPLAVRPRPWPVFLSAMSLRVALVAAGVLAVGALWLWKDGDKPAERQERTAERTASDNGADPVNTTPEKRVDGATTASPAPDRERDLFGVVVDGDGQPIVGARVSTTLPFSRAALLHGGAPEAGPHSVTDSVGRFRLRLSRGARATLRVAADGYPAEVAQPCQAGERVRIVLRRAAGELVVQTVQGADIAVRLLPHASVQAHADKTGRAVLQLPVGPVTVTARHPLGGIATATAHVPGRVELRPLAGRLVTGFVRGANGRLIVGARVGEGWELRRSVLTDASGHYELRTRAPILFAFADGFGTAQKHAGARAAIDFLLHEGDECSGRVLDAGGRPLAGARVVAMASRHDDVMQHIDSRHARTDARGLFVLTSLRRDLAHTLVVQAAGHGRKLVDFSPHPERAGRVMVGDIRLPVPSSLAGRVTGASVPRARVRLELRLLEAHHLGAFYGTIERRRTDDLGRFRFVDLGPGSYELAVHPFGRPAVRHNVEIDGAVSGFEVDVPVAAMLRVRVVDTDGDAVAGAHVRVAQRHHAETDPSGHAIVNGLEYRPYDIDVYPGRTPHFAGHEKRVVPSEEEITIVLEKAVRVQGRVLGPNGEPLGAVLVVGYDPATGRPRARATTDGQGRFALSLRSGETVDIAIDGTRPHPSTETLAVYGAAPGVRAPASGITVRTGAMPRDRTLTVRVVDPAGKPVAGVRVEAHNTLRFPRPDPQAQRGTTGRDGKVRFERLARRRFRIRVTGGSAGLVGPAPVEARPGRGMVTLRLEKGAEFAGVVRFADGRVAPGVRIVLRTKTGDKLAETKSNTEGWFVLLGRPTVLHQIYAELKVDATFAYQRYLHDLKPGAPIEVKLPARPR